MNDNLKLELLKTLLGCNNDNQSSIPLNCIDSEFIGKYCVIRTYSAGVWAGIVDKKYKDEIILKDARRLWRWKTKESISLSAIALSGLDYCGSKICEKLDMVWLQPIEIIPCTNDASESIKLAPVCAAEQ